MTKATGKKTSIPKKQKSPSPAAKPVSSKNKNSKKVTQTTTTQPVRNVVAELVDDDQQSSEIDLQPETDFHDTTSTSVERIDDAELFDQSDAKLPQIVSKDVSIKDPLTAYLNEIRKYPLLTKEEEQRLAKKYFETKDPDAAQTLVKSNLRFVVKIAAEYAKFSARMIDLIQEGNVGLMHAVKEYNPYKGARLITYAVWWIRGYIQEYLMRQFSMVRIGTTANQRKLFYQLQRQKAELEKMSQPENIALLSHQLGIPEDEIKEMAQRLSGRDVSLDKAADDDSGLSLGQLLRKDDGSLPIDEQMALEEQLALLKEAIDAIKDKLSDKEKILLEERVLNDEPLTLQEIGDKYGISREAVRQNEARLIQKIKTSLSEVSKKKS